MSLIVPPDPELALRSTRLSLEPVVASHIPELWELYRDPELHTYIPIEPTSIEVLRERFERWCRRRSKIPFFST